jgi:hypothetical protein
MTIISFPLTTTPEQRAQLDRLRSVFAQVCNELTPQVQKTGIWDRVALHHLYYRALREKYPQLGSQMVCNAIYAVSKICRIVYQGATHATRQNRRADQNLPLFRFAPTCPVYFDRHTLSIVSGGLSLFTMDGRVRFEIQIPEHELTWFKHAKLYEIVLQERQDQVFELSFELADPLKLNTVSAGLSTQIASEAEIPMTKKSKIHAPMAAVKGGHQQQIPDYVYVQVA